MLALRLAALAALALPAWAAIVPTSPSGGTVVQVGQDIQALWNEDTTGAWTDVEIQLMTGDNLQMVALATVATGIDGTTTNSLNIPCPDVSPYSKIYFLQFTRGGDVSTATWTTRFTIASASGETVPPEQSTVYNGESVQWGTGALVNAAPAPITGTGSSSNSTGTSGSTNGTDAGMASAMPSSTGPARVTTISTMASASATDDSAVNAAAVSSGSMSSMSAASSVRSGSATPASASPSASQSGAALKGSTVGLGAVVLGLAGLVAL